MSLWGMSRIWPGWPKAPHSSTDRPQSRRCEDRAAVPVRSVPIDAGAAMSRFARFALLFAGLAGLGPALAQSDTELLRVEEAFAMTSTAVDHGAVRLEWKIADGYYLYRSRIKTGKPGD